MNKKRFDIKSLLWNSYHKAPNPIGILSLSWIIAVAAGVYLINTVGQDVAMDKTKYIAFFGVGATILSWLYIEIKKAIKKNGK